MLAAPPSARPGQALAAGAQKTKLERRRLGRIYLQRLRRCRRHFQEWLCANGISLDPGSAEPAVLDAVLARYLDAAHQCGLPVYLPKHAVLDIQFERRELRHRLPRTWDSIRAWESIVGWRGGAGPPPPRPPAPARGGGGGRFLTFLGL